MKNYSRIFSLRNKKMLIMVSILLVLACILSAIFIVREKLKLAGQTISVSTLIQVENAKPGTVGWRITKQATNQIQAYAGEMSINKGEYVHLYVSTIF